MEKVIYHGSEKIIEKPEFGAGKKYNDYGLGFYCTENPEMAKEWAVSPGKNGFSNCYRISTDGMDILDLNSDEYIVLHWLTLLLQNREFNISSALAREAKRYLLKNFSIDIQNRDIILGYRADDSYFSFAQDFINGTISYRELGEAMRLGKLGQQFVLKSRRAFESLEFLGAEPVRESDYLERKMQRDQSARREYLGKDKTAWHKGEIYMVQILDEEMKENDTRLR